MHGCDARSLLQAYLLLLIYERPGHGYDLIGRLDRMGVSDVEPGHAYRVLRGLEREGLVVSAWVPSETGPARRRYELTKEGVDDLGDWMAKLTHLGQVIASFVARWDVVSRPPSRRPLDGGRAVSWS